MTNKKYSALLALGVLVSMTACGSSDPGVTNAEEDAAAAVTASPAYAEAKTLTQASGADRTVAEEASPAQDDKTAVLPGSPAAEPAVPTSLLIQSCRT